MLLSQGELPVASEGSGRDDRVKSGEAWRGQLQKEEDPVHQNPPEGDQQQRAERQPARVLPPSCHWEPEHLPVIIEELSAQDVDFVQVCQVRFRTAGFLWTALFIHRLERQRRSSTSLHPQQPNALRSTRLADPLKMLSSYCCGTKSGIFIYKCFSISDPDNVDEDTQCTLLYFEPSFCLCFNVACRKLIDWATRDKENIYLSCKYLFLLQRQWNSIQTVLIKTILHCIDATFPFSQHQKYLCWFLVCFIKTCLKYDKI